MLDLEVHPFAPKKQTAKDNQIKAESEITPTKNHMLQQTNTMQKAADQINSTNTEINSK